MTQCFVLYVFSPEVKLEKNDKNETEFKGIPSFEEKKILALEKCKFSALLFG